LSRFYKKIRRRIFNSRKFADTYQQPTHLGGVKGYQMAISKIQQSQISGSLSFDDSLAAGSGLAGKSTLKGDLDALRSQVNKIIGKSNWYDAIDGSQDLADIYAAVRMSGANADFQGTLDVTGAATLDSSLSVAGASNLQGMVDVGGALFVDGPAGLSGSLDVAGIASFAQAANVGGNLAVGGGYGDTGVTVYANGNLSMDGNLVAGGTLGVGGAASFDSTVQATGQINAMGGVVAANVVSAGSGSFVGAVSAGSFSTAGTLAAGASTLSSLGVSGNASVGGTLGVTGAATFSSTLQAGASTLSSLSVTGPSMLGSTLNVAGGSTLASAAIIGSASVGGAFQVGGGAIINGGATVSSGLSVTSGGASISGASTFSSTLGVTGAATFSSAVGVSGILDVASTISASALKIDGDTAQRLYIVDADGSLKDESKLIFDGSKLDIDGGVEASSLKIDGDVAQRLYIVDADGSIKDESKLVFDGSDLSITGGLRVSGNAQVDGDLLVKGAFTYIETTNMKVKDAFIYLATGSNGAVDSGIVLSKGAGASHDLVIGQDGGAGELIFAQVAHNADGDSPADLNNATLAKAWMSGSLYGVSEGQQSGMVGMLGADFAVAGTNILVLKAGSESFSLAGAGEQATFDGKFDATTIIGAINELHTDLAAASAGGNLSKASYGVAAFAGNVLSFAAQQTLAAADHKLVDVYLNGVLMAPGRDLTAISTTSVTFDSSIVSSLIADDVIVVIARG
jgi:hypothetical protein